MSKQRQLAAIVFSDVSGYTSMMDKDDRYEQFKDQLN